VVKLIIVVALGFQFGACVSQLFNVNIVLRRLKLIVQRDNLGKIANTTISKFAIKHNRECKTTFFLNYQRISTPLFLEK
jgi:hypothetical protein